MKLLLFFISFATFANEVQMFKPHENPAKLKRTITGFTEPCRFIEIEAEYPERLSEYKVAEGEVLNNINGKLIAIQNSKLVQLELKAAEVGLETQKQRLKTQISLENLEERNVEYRKLEKDRIKKLSDQGKVPKANFDKVLYDYDQAKLKLTQSRQSVALEKQLITEAEVKLEQISERLKRHSIYGPHGWVLNKRYAEAGSWLKTGDLICQIVDIRELSVNLRLGQEEYETLLRGDFKLIHKNKSIKARFHKSDLTYDPVTRKRHVELRIPQTEFIDASGGLEVQLKLEVNYPQPAVKIPNKFVNSGLEQYWLTTLDDKRIIIRPLRKNAAAFIVDKNQIPENTVIKETRQ